MVRIGRFHLYVNSYINKHQSRIYIHEYFRKNGMKIGIRGGEVVDFLIDVKDGVAYAESSSVKN